MAKDTDEKKDVVLLTEEEYDKKQREKIKNKANTISRVGGVGLYTFLFIISCPLFFNLSFLGAIFPNTKEKFVLAWGTYADPYTGGLLKQSGLYWDPLEVGPFFGQLLVTLVFLASCLFMIYYITLNLTDFIIFIKNIKYSAINFTKEISSNVKSSITDEVVKAVKKPVKKKNLFDDKDKKLDIKPEPKKRRKEKPTSELDGYTSEQLDALLKGEVIEKPADGEENAEIKVVPIDVDKLINTANRGEEIK